MELAIHHQTHYAFDGPAVLQPHVVRLRPRTEPGQRLLAFSLVVTPEPAVRAEHLDAHGNVVTELWFEGATRALTIETRLTVERLETNPFQYLLRGNPDLLRTGYPPALAAQLTACLETPDAPAPVVRALAREIAEERGWQPDRFAAALAARVRASVTHEVREDGDPHAPATTLQLGRGSCRDVTVLYVACCRAVGLAARFVSGYMYDPDLVTPPELHAWSEVYLPGGGWRGFDPGEGLAVSQHHIALAAAPAAADAAPVSGTFFGTGVTGTMHTTLDISRAPEV